jgi:protein-S-isoprenylcysteine O-methyltransferase Ste14
MPLNHIILASLWVLYCVLHSLLASISVKNRVRQLAGKNFRYYRLFYTLFAALFLVLLVYYQLSLQSEKLFQLTVPTILLGAVLGLTGLGLMAICIRKYFFSLSGMKSLFQESPADELMITGIHRYMRHPLYTGTFLAIWGAWVLFPFLSLLLSNAVITGYTLLAIRLEEEKLVAAFGDDYKAYQQRVPKLLPHWRIGRKI